MARLLAPAIGASLFLGTLSGCLEDDELAQTIESVSGSLESLAAPGTAVPGDALRTSTYENAIRSLRPLVGEGSPAQQAAAHLLIARSEFGLASTPAGLVADAHSEARNMMSAMRAEAAKLVRLNSMADAVASFDPSDEIAELEGRVAQRTESISAQEATLAEIVERIAALDAQAAEAEAQASAIRVEESGLRDRANALPAPEALPIFKQAAELRERSDRLSAEAERIRARADVIRPEVGEVEAEIARLTEQRSLFRQSIEELNAELANARRESQAISDQAQAARATISEMAGSLEAMVTTQMAEAFDEAVQAFGSAASSASRAAAGDRSGSRLLSAEIAQSKAGLAANHAEILGSVANSLQDAGFNEKAGSIAELASAASSIALEAFGDAKAGFEASGLRGDDADRIDSVIARIDERLGVEPQPETQTDPGMDTDEPASETPEPGETTDGGA